MSELSLLEKTKAIIRALMVSTPNPLTINQLERDYHQNEGTNIPFQQLGYTDLKSFLMSIPDVLTWNEYNRWFTPVVDANTGNAHILKLVEGQRRDDRKKSKRQNDSTRQRFNNNTNSRQHQHQNVWDNPPTGYYQQKFNFNQQSTNRIPPQHQPGLLLSRPSHYQQSLLGKPPSLMAIPTIPPLMGIVTIQPPMQNFNGQHKQATKQRHGMIEKKPAPNDKNLNGHAKTSVDQSDSKADEIGALPPIDDDDPIRFIGMKKMNSEYGTRIPTATLPQTLKTGDIRQICVTEVIAFPRFYFQFQEMEDTMRGIQEDLNSRYENEYADSIQLSQVQVGNVCAVYCSGKWSRAEILERPDQRDRIKLLFVDYGTIDCVSIDHVRHLRKELCECPRLCHQGTLAFLEPLHYKIESKILKKFCELVADKSLMAVFSNVDKNKSISMTLVDTSSPTDDVIINKILMENLV